MLTALPALLVMPASKVKQIVKEEVGSRKRTLLVQAVSQYRQRRVHETVISLNNLISCVRLMPEEKAMPWKERSELLDVFGVFCAKEESDAKRSLLQALLGLSSEDVASATSAVNLQAAKRKAEDDDENFL